MQKTIKRKYFLIFAIKGIIFKTYDKIHRTGTNQANQYGTNAFKSVFIKQPSDFRAYDPIWCFQTPSLSLCPGSSNNRTTITCARAEECIYSQASSQLNPADQGQSSYNRSINQQLNCSCTGAFPQHRRGSWLRNSIAERCNWNISTIVWQIRNCPRFIGYWLRITFGFSITWQPIELIVEIK